MTSTVTDLDLTTAQERADAAAAAAQAVRDRVAVGNSDTTVHDLAEAEAAERFARHQLDAALERHHDEQERHATEQLERDRAQVQTEWESLSREPDELRNFRVNAATACADYLAAAADYEDVLDELNERARRLGFRVHERSRPSPLPTLAREIRDAARDRCDARWITPRMDAPYGSMWGE